MDYGCCRKMAEVVPCQGCKGHGCKDCNNLGYKCRDCGAPVNVETMNSNAPSAPRPKLMEAKILQFRPQDREVRRKG